MYSKRRIFGFHIFSLYNFALFIHSFVLSELSDNKALDLCGGHTEIDLSSLNYGSPWKVSLVDEKEKDLIEILPCKLFESLKNTVPPNCSKSSICRRIGDGTHIGYKPIHVESKFGSYLVRYEGPYCPAAEKAYTIDIRFTCGSHLGYPSFPPRYIINNCSTILYWETAAACKTSSSVYSFGLDESPCYVLDNKGARRDLTPLIRPNGSYKLWTSSSSDFFINVCAAAVDKCGNHSSACFKNEQGQMESVGSFKWSSIEFHSANQLVNNDYIELTYKMKNSKCQSLNQNESTTIIRFICPKDRATIRRYPVLLSNLDCRFEIEWLTDFACPQTEISLPEQDCKFGDIDFNQLKNDTYFEFKNIVSNSSFRLNICGPISDSPCPQGSFICVSNNETGIPVIAFQKKDGKFLKHDNDIMLSYTSSKTSCKIGKDSKFSRVFIKFECGASVGKPEFFGYDQCNYIFLWRTKVVCGHLPPTCAISSDQLGFQVDLSSLTLFNHFYEVQESKRSTNDLKGSTSKILFNICGNLEHLDETIKCGQASACLVDKKNPTTFIDLGHFNKALTFNKPLRAFQLHYTGGHDPYTNRTLNTLINFHCQSPKQNSQPQLLEFDEEIGQYTIEFNTPAACPLQTVRGTDCTVIDPLTDHVHNLTHLAAEHYYTVKSGKFDFEINVCRPIMNGSCGEGVAICQQENSGQRRAFSLGKSNSLVSYWNSMLNMTFIGGTPYNNAEKTPRMSHIEFICDPNAGTGFPEFDGELDRAYFFRWYTSSVCSDPVPKITHCVFENETHFVDFTPLSLEHGNQFLLLDEPGSIVFINFCRPLNRVRDNILRNCKPNSGICLVNSEKQISLGEPASLPFMSFDGNIYMLYNNGDQCPANTSLSITSRVRFECDATLTDDLSMTLIDPILDPLYEGNPCTYEFIVRSPLACPRLLNELQLVDCVFTNKRTNLSADFNQLTLKNNNYKIGGSNGPNSEFSLNICKPTQSSPQEKECKNSAVCYRNANNELLSYGKVSSAKLYLDNNNLHLRFTNGSLCDAHFDNRARSTDIEFICDHSAHASKPTLSFQNHCLAKFKWHTSAVCNLNLPSCSLIDEFTGRYYSLRPLSSLSHAWNVSLPESNEHYLINLCKPLPTEHHCGPSSAACKCQVIEEEFKCNQSIGKVSDHELTIDSATGDLILLYENGEQICNNLVAQTSIRFRCSMESGHLGPKFVGVSDCIHHFVWDTTYACSRQQIENHSIKMHIEDNFLVHDQTNQLKWDLHSLFAQAPFKVFEPIRPKENDNYVYVFDFEKRLSEFHQNCANATICQTKPANGFQRDVGTVNNWRMTYVGSDLFMVLHSNNSICGRNKHKFVTTKIRFECSPSTGISQPNFHFESEDCDFFFVWKTSAICEIVESSISPSILPQTASSRISFVWIIFSIALLTTCVFAVWLLMSGSSRRDDVVFHIRRVFRRNDAPQIPFRYQQLSL